MKSQRNNLAGPAPTMLLRIPLELKARFAAADPIRAVIMLQAFLLLLMCLRVWGLGITHTDDATWALTAYQPGADSPSDWARSQGRLWAYPVGLLISHTLHWQNTVYGELLRLGSFALFFLAFHVVVAVYCARRTAALCATLFLAFCMLRWDGSILTTYPMLSWVAGISLAIAILCARSFARSGSAGALAAAALFLFYALFNNEGITVLFAWVFLLSIAANAVQVDIPGNGLVLGRIPRRSFMLLLVLGAASLLYAVLSIAWMKTHPSTYDGHGIAPFNAGRIWSTLLQFSTSGSALHDLFKPYAVVYANVSEGNGERMVYHLLQGVGTLWLSPLALLAGAMLALLTWLNLSGTGTGRTRQLSRAGGLLTGMAALSFAILPVLPVALTEKYQNWSVNLGVQSYSHTLMAHFGWSLLLAVLLLACVDKLRSRAKPATLLLPVLALLIGALGALAYRTNDRIANDMRPEAGRWQALESALALNNAQFHATKMWIPRFADGSWYTVLSKTYWTEYAKARYNAGVNVVTFAPPLEEAMGSFLMLDYAFTEGGRALVSLATQIDSMADGFGYRSGKIVVQLSQPRIPGIESYVLAYEDLKGHALRTRLGDLQHLDAEGTLFGVSDSQAQPASIRLLRTGRDGKDVEVAHIRGVPELRIVQGSAQLYGGQPASRNIVLGEGWHPLEARGVWSKADAQASIAKAALPEGDVRIRLDLNTYTGLGFTTGRQTVSLSAGGKKLADWTYTTHVAPPDATITVPATLRAANGDLQLHFSVSPGFVPSQLKLAPDDRELGLLLRGVRVAPAK